MMTIENIQEAFGAYEAATLLEDKERLLSVAFDRLVEFLEGGVTEGEVSVCKNIALRCLNSLEIQGSKFTADEISRDALEMTTAILGWRRLVQAVRDSGYAVPASLNSMDELIWANYLGGLFRSSR